VNYAIELDNVSLVRGGAYILDNISLKIPIGESVAIIGPNGSGKTSLMNILKGNARPYYDERRTTICKLFGNERWNIFDLRKKLGIVSTHLQSRFNDNASLGAVILSGFFRTIDVYKDHKITDAMVIAAENAASRVGISDKLKRDVGKLSLGEMRRALIARALVAEPEMLLLDEPMTGLDIVMMDKFKTLFDFLIDKGTGIIMITHSLEDIPKNVHRVIMMKDGKIFNDGSKDRALTSENVSSLFSAPMKVTEENGTYRMMML
jgi:iron complex transport system ATP-binding protein